jgi:predicted anti-sigma-YlaC factor YlaD
MHQPIRDNLEEYLKGSARRVPQEFHEHLAACEDCAAEFSLFQGQSALLRSLRVDGDNEPRAGFYARVMDRIEQEDRSSIWSILLQPHFGRRLAMASAALVVLMGAYLVTSESGEPDIAGTDPVVFSGAPTTASIEGLQQQQRDAVLVNLATYQE